MDLQKTTYGKIYLQENIVKREGTGQKREEKGREWEKDRKWQGKGGKKKMEQNRKGNERKGQDRKVKNSTAKEGKGRGPDRQYEKGWDKMGLDRKREEENERDRCNEKGRDA